jgi:hypothetical protein
MTSQAQVAQLQLGKTMDSNPQAVDPHALRGNIVEDLLIQINTQLAYIQTCFCPLQDSGLKKAEEVEEREYLNNLTSTPAMRCIAGDLLDTVARSMPLLCSYANMYFRGWPLSISIIRFLTSVQAQRTLQ